MWQSGHARVRLGVMTKFALLVIVGAAVIFSEFFLLLSRMHLSALHHCVLELSPFFETPLVIGNTDSASSGGVISVPTNYKCSSCAKV